MSLGDLKVALVHDELTRRGGAEIVLEEFVRIFPQADIFALYAGKPEMIVDGRVYRVTTSFLQRWPEWWRRHPARVLPFLPQAAEQFDLSNYDVVISSASAFAKSIVTRVSVPHLCYCHTPTRYLWSDTHAATRGYNRWLAWPARGLLHYLRLADFAGAQRVGFFLANSRSTAARITSYYRRESTVVYPPIDTAFFTPLRPTGFTGQAPHENYFLLVGRLTPSKNFDQAIEACEKLRLPLVVVGVGHEYARLKAYAGRHTRFVGRVSAQELRGYLRAARALLQPGEEDFGMAAAEALACGTPVIALNRGGVREIVERGVTGILYDEPRIEFLAEALRQFLTGDAYFSPEIMQRSMLKFSRPRFHAGIREAVGRILGT